MPVAQTYTALLESVRRYIERGFTAASDPEVYAQLPALVTLGERRCARELKILGFQNVVTSAMISGTAVYQKPDRWKQTISLNFGNGTDNNTRNPLFARAYEYVRQYWPDQTATGTPRFYADYDYQHFIFAPTPDAAYPFELLYYQLLPLLDDSNQTNWLTENAPELLLYATLLESAPFLKNPDQIGIWQAFYDRTASATNGEDIQRILDRQAVRSKD